MSILLATALSIGNAVRLTLEVPTGTDRTRVLRAERPYIAGPADTDAKIIADGIIFNALDIECENGTQYWYQAYHYIGGNWIEAGGLVTAIPNATYVDNSVDAQTLIRDRLAAGLKIEEARGKLSVPRNGIKVLTAPPVFDDSIFPVVTVHLKNDAPGERFLSESIGGDIRDDSGDWVEQEGWLASDDIEVVGWSLNPDERLELRKAIRRVLVANLAIFDAFGINNFTPRFSDIEDFDSYSAPVYQTMCTITCNSPVAVGGPSNAIEEVTVVVNEEITP